jgi:hypothetical protein
MSGENAGMSEIQKKPPAVQEFGRFAKQWLKTALGGVWGKIGDAATFLGLVVPAISGSNPAWWHKFIALLHVSGNEALLWEAPVGVGGSILLVRLVLAPFWIMRSEREAAKQSLDDATRRVELSARKHDEALESQRAAFETSRERLERRIAELERPAPRIVVEVTDDTERPFLLRNVGPVEAHRVQILPIVDNVWTVEFDAVDTIYSNGSGNPRLVVSRSDEEIGLVFRLRFEYFLKGVRESTVSDLMDTATGEPVTPDFAARIDAAFEDIVSNRPMVIEYSDESGARMFRTEYNYRANAVADNLSVEFVRRYVVEDH